MGGIPFPFAGGHRLLRRHPERHDRESRDDVRDGAARAVLHLELHANRRSHGEASRIARSEWNLETLATLISTIAGNGSPGFSGDGGPALNAAFVFLRGLALSGATRLFVADACGGVSARVFRVGGDCNELRPMKPVGLFGTQAYWLRDSGFALLPASASELVQDAECRAP